MTTHWLVHLATVVALVSKVASDWDFRGFDFGDEDSELIGPYEKAFNDDYSPFEFGLGSFGLMSDSPRYARMTSYVDPVESRFARNKRKSEASAEDDVEEDDEEGDEKSEGDGSVDDYADRYERFVSRHFRDRDDRRKKDERKAEEGKGDEGSEYDYRFDFSPSDDYERIKQESEAQSRQLAKDPKNCKAYEQDGMLCHVCRDAESDTTSESCAYATDPHHKKFAYVKQKNYNSSDPENVEPEQEPKAEDEPEAERDVEEVEEDEASEENAQLKAHPQKKRAETTNERPQKPHVIPTKKPVVHAKPGSYSSNGGGYRYQPVDLRSNKERPQIQSHQQSGIVHPTYNEFYTHLFPSQDGDHSQRLQQQQQQQQQEPALSPDEVYALKYQNKDDVAKVLAEFEARDWSNCKKGKKNELTCYQCTDKAGVKHEECMYVSESRQVSSKVLPATVAAVNPAASEPMQKPTKKSRRKKVTSEKKAVSPKLKNASSSSSNLSGKLIQLEPSESDVATGGEEAVAAAAAAPTHRGQERQTVKRTVSIKSYVDGSGKQAKKEPVDGERVMHYEHHITHVL
ncbi:glutactin [Toxorhynchites rutilus septentrionalis]|uniref:glutactin n=1 Tax=Toxorhynchites rutilus septentrionalis TaxID=329112 RepID=UPI00247A64BE|nr:glutactin [Toxorhynchites rutilus septentrionalis]